MAESSNRESIWSVHKDDLDLYSHLFGVFWLIGISVHLWDHCLTDLDRAVGTTGLTAAVSALIFLWVRDVLGWLWRIGTKRGRRVYATFQFATGLRRSQES